METPEKILVVDDEELIRNMISRALSSEGYDCLTAESTDQALSMLQGQPVSLVLSDIMMSGRPGTELLAEITRHYPEVKVLMITALGDSDTAIDCMRQGAVNYITKPFSLSQLLDAVKVALKRRRDEIEVLARHEQIEGELLDRQGEMQRAAEELCKLDQRKSDFLASVSHELLTPLNSIIGFSEILTDPGVSEAERQEFLQSIIQQGLRLKEIIEAMLTANELQCQHIDLHREAVGIGEMLAGAVAEMQRANPERKYVLDCAAGLPDIQLDQLWFKTVLSNLLDNAVKCTAAGDHIGVTACLKKAGVRISITDSGIGIPAKDLNYVFEEFYQVGNSLVDKKPGIGLGLSFCRRIVELHGGKIWAESEGEGQGCTINLVLAVAEES
jgi:signal transduction histidine kinase